MHEYLIVNLEMNLDDYITVYGCTPLSLVLSIFILFYLVVLFRLKNEARLFIYLAIEAFYILIDTFISLFLPFIKCKGCFTNISPLFLDFLATYMLFNFSTVIEMCALLMAITAALNCYSMLAASTNKSYLFIFQLSPYLLALFVFIVSLLTFSYQYFGFEYTMLLNETYLRIRPNEFGSSQTFRILTLISFGIGDFLLVVLLIFINCIIIVKLKKNFNKSSTIMQNISSAQKRRNTEKKMTKLVLIDSLALCFGRISAYIYLIFSTFLIKGEPDFPIKSLLIILIYFSFVMKLLLFYMLNSRFRYKTNMILVSFKRKIIFK